LEISKVGSLPLMCARNSESKALSELRIRTTDDNSQCGGTLAATMSGSYLRLWLKNVHSEFRIIQMVNIILFAFKGIEKSIKNNYIICI
jgi:hypothetical protein